MILNALIYFLALPYNLSPEWYFYLVEGIILIINFVIIYVLMKSKDWPFLFFFLLVTMTLKPFYLFTNLIVKESVPMINITEAILLFILTFAIEKSGKKVRH